MTITIDLLDIVLGLLGIAYFIGLFVFRSMGIRALFWPVVWLGMALFWRL